MIVVNATLIWLIIAGLAIVNGVIRDKIVASQIGPRLALPISGVSLAMIVLAVTWLFFGMLGERGTGGYLLTGAQWVMMTLAFEFLFGHYVAGKSWGDLLQTFNVARGDLFSLVLVVTLLAPLLVASMK